MQEQLGLSAAPLGEYLVGYPRFSLFLFVCFLPLKETNSLFLFFLFSFNCCWHCDHLIVSFYAWPFTAKRSGKLDSAFCVHARCSLDFCLRQGTQLVFSWCTGTLWLLLGFWCGRMPVWSLLHPFWHGCWFLFQIIDFMSFINLHLSDLFFSLSISISEHFLVSKWSLGLLWFHVWGWLWWRISDICLALLCSEWCRYWRGIIFLILHLTFLWLFDLINWCQKSTLVYCLWLIIFQNAMNLFV